MEALIQILTDMHPDVDVRTCNTLIDDNILDSFDIVTLIADILDVYGVRIPADHILPQYFNSVSALYEMIQTLKKED